jgi:hypothetical protein
MDFLRAAASAASAALAGSGGIPGLPGYTLGERDLDYEGLSIWSLYEGVKKVRRLQTRLRALLRSSRVRAG